MKYILLVDDDEDMLALSSRWLQKGGYEVESVTSGQAALDSIRGRKPDLVLLDYIMPEMDGPAVLEKIRSDEAMKDTPVIFRTGKDDEESSDVMSRLHPEGIVPKSAGKPGLMKKLDELIGGCADEKNVI